MSERDVSGDGMTNHELTDAQLQALLEGTTGSSLDDHPVASFFGDTRAAFSAVEAPSPNAVLAEFVGVGQADSTINAADTPPVVDAPLHDVTLLDPVGAPRRRTNMIPALTAFIGTTIGKIAVGGSVAFAATAGAHATGVVDVPGLPDPAVSIVDSIDDNSDDGQSASTDSTPSTTTGVVATDDSNSNDSSTAPTVASTTSSTTTSPTSSSSTPSTSIAAAGQGALVSIAVLDAGVVDVRFDPTEPTLVRSFALDGWQSRIDDADELGEIDLIFTNGTQRVDFSLEYDDGFARARIRDRATESESFMWYSLEDGSLVRGPVGDDDSDTEDDSDNDDDSDDSDDSDDRDDDSDSDDDVDDDQDDIDDDDTDSDDEDEDDSDSDDSDDIDDDDSDDSDDRDDD